MLLGTEEPAVLLAILQGWRTRGSEIPDLFPLQNIWQILSCPKWRLKKPRWEYLKGPQGRYYLYHWKPSKLSHRKRGKTEKTETHSNCNPASTQYTVPDWIKVISFHSIFPIDERLSPLWWKTKSLRGSGCLIFNQQLIGMPRDRTMHLHSRNKQKREKDPWVIWILELVDVDF